MLTYRQEGEVAVLTLDDGKANALGHELMDALNDALNRVEQEAQAVVIQGRPGRFSAGFDLKELTRGPEASAALVGKGARLLLRLFRFPMPVVAACTGHAVAGGALLLLATDTRIGVRGDFRYVLNETAIGVELPTFGVQLALARLSKRHHTAAVIQSKVYSPEEAINAGFVDAVVEAEELEAAAIQHATALTQLPTLAYTQNKLSMRKEYIARIETGLNDSIAMGS